MGKRIRAATVLAFWLAGAWAWQLGSSPPAMACGGVFVRSMWKDERRPSLAYEQTLLIHDAEKGREHFIRQVSFRASAEAFGFVVPTPTRPEVAKVAGDPFERLRSMFPFRRLDELRKGQGALRPGSSGGGLSASSVQVLEQKKVGSFTAFVLAAKEPKALANWLEKQDFASTPETEAWLAHYVKLGFYYVAMRYDPPAQGAGGAPDTQAEVVRFSFDSPLPFYPYLEPRRSDAQPRMLELWLVSQRSGVPVALREVDGATSWTRPLIEGMTFERGVRADLESGLGKEKSLLPDGEIVVQRFVDQKTTRQGFGDVLFVPKRPLALDDAAKRRIAPLLPVLDPSLADAKQALP